MQHEHTTGRWGQNIAEAEINETKDYVILNCYEHEIDYMFSESVSSYYWIYNLHTMKKFKVEEDLTYKYLYNSLGVKEVGVDSVKFSDNNPYKILINYSDTYGENKKTITLELPKK